MKPRRRRRPTTGQKLRVCQDIIEPIGQRYVAWGQSLDVEEAAGGRLSAEIWSLLRDHHYDFVLPWLKLRNIGAAQEFKKLVERPKKLYAKLEFRCLQILSGDFRGTLKSPGWRPHAVSMAIYENKLTNGLSDEIEQIGEKYGDLHAIFAESGRKLVDLSHLLRSREREVDTAVIKTDTGQKSLPNNPEILRAAKYLRDNLRHGGSEIGHLRDFCGGDDAKAKTLARQLRRYPNVQSLYRGPEKADA